MPERVVRNSDLLDASDELGSDEFFAGVLERRFGSPDYTSKDLGVAALNKLLRRNNVRAEDLDLIIVSAQFNDTFSPGIGTAVQHAVGATSAAVLHVDNGCCAWISSVSTAQAFIDSGRYRKVAVVTVTNFVSRLTAFQATRESWVLGDGASATLLVADTGADTILSVHEQAFGENWGALRVEPDPVDGVALPHWDGGHGPLTVKFNAKMLLRLWQVAMERLPEAVESALRKADMTPDDVAWLITHQPNENYIAEWRKRCGVDPARTHDTLAHYGNMFHSSLPVTFADALDKDMISAGDVITFATFTHGGEMVSSMVWRWTG
ncbi:3-oxoacyl-ACP synthase III family protein [Embleya sp. NBC_00896]|uniref:3-oxoacyl-ACP synthase III family protein n=1 Tax=Embleya sp. NBC_00896 TaxID=2975961 RepID=UPI003867F3EC|nr:3-oxoacyl-ACP synthase [Embleya sp. NBC_00896]